MRVGVSPDGTGFAVDSANHRVRHYTAQGSFLSEWGTRGSGNGEFEYPGGVAVSPTGSRVYVADKRNYRIQYFNRNEPTVAPTSLGRVKALFR
jgi:DNA-binding beta-propeller fold protein YncE